MCDFIWIILHVPFITQLKIINYYVLNIKIIFRYNNNSNNIIMYKIKFYDRPAMLILYFYNIVK